MHNELAVMSDVWAMDTRDFASKDGWFVPAGHRVCELNPVYVERLVGTVGTFGEAVVVAEEHAEFEPADKFCLYRMGKAVFDSVGDDCTAHVLLGNGHLATHFSEMTEGERAETWKALFDINVAGSRSAQAVANSLLTSRAAISSAMGMMQQVERAKDGTFCFDARAAVVARYRSPLVERTDSFDGPGPERT